MKTISRGKKPFLLSMISFIAVMLMIVGCGGGGGTGPVVPDTQQPIIHEMKYEGEAGTDITSDSRAAAQGTLYVKASDNQTQSNQLTFDIKNGNGSFTSYTVTKGNDGYYVKEVAMRPQNIYERGNFDGFDATARVRDASGNGTLEKRFFDLALSEQAGRQAITEAKDNVPISGFDTAGGFAEDQQVDIQGRNVSVDLVGHFTGGDSGWRELSVKYYNINDTEDAAFQNIVFNQGNVRIARYSYLGGNNRGYFVWLETNLNYSTSKDTLEAALNFIKTDSGLEDDDVTLTAQASPASGGDVRINSGMWGDSKNVTVNSGTQVTLQASAVSGYTFEGWYDGSVKVSSNTTYQVTATANKTYKANFTQNASQYTITAQASPASGGDVRINSGTWGDSKNVTVNSGTQATLEAAAASGYTFEGWYDGSVKVSLNTSYQVTATANKTYKANFTQNAAQYTITVQASPANGGDVRINSGTWGDSKSVTVNSGTQVTLQASAVSGYTFEGWYDGSVKVSSNTTYQVTATANKTYKANFTQNAAQYTITAQASPASGGDVRINSGTWGDSKNVTVNSGTQVTLEASAVSGYTFEGWYDGSVKVSSNTTYQVTATANKTYKANFTQNATQYTITAQASPASGGDVRINSGTWGDDKSVIVNSGTQVTLEASAVSGYTFEGWYDGSVKVGSNTTYQVTATANKTYKAEFIHNTGITFFMGNTRDDSEGQNREKPVYGVILTYDYWIAPYELTFNEYDAYCEDTGKTKPNDEEWGRGTRPVIRVSWWDAIKYCNWLSIENGFAPAYNETTGALLDQSGNVTTDITQVEGYRLPTEAEWEYAARGGSVDITNGIEANDYKYAESNNLNEVGWYYSNSGGKTHPVGEKDPNELGLYDMSGNVYEWCHDWYGGYASTTQTNRACKIFCVIS